MRLYHELAYHEDSVFLTLTYDEEKLPENGTLVKRDLELFLKRLRKSLSLTERKIRYFAVGEYGDKTQRPHYHLIIYGLGLSPVDKEYVMRAWSSCDWNVPSIAKNSFGTVEPSSIRYVAQYVQKKFSGPLAEEEYERKNRIAPFRLLSLGIGKQYALDNAEQIKQNLAIRYSGVDMSIPRYYCNLIGIEPDVLKTKAVEADKVLVEKITGLADLSRDELYKTSEVAMNIRVIKRQKDGKAQYDKNLQAKTELYERKL